jgi:large subunit ribosomal protein L18
MNKIELKKKRMWRREMRVRGKLLGTPERPRLTVYRSHKHIYAQVIDDLAGKTLCSASTTVREIRDTVKHGGDLKAAELVGSTLGQRAVMHGIKRVVFDRGPYRYHGRIKALADAARKAGLEF